MEQSNLGSPAPLLSRRSLLKAAGGLLLTGAALPALAGCRSEAGDQIFRSQRKITDHAGRELTIPTADAIERVYFTSGLAEIYIFTLDPGLAAGTAARWTEQQLAYLPERMAELSYMGAIAANGTIDREMLMKKQVQVVFSISGVELSASNISDAEDLQNSTGIPVVLVDGSFDKITEAYRFIGDILGYQERAAEIAEYLERIYAEVTQAVGSIPQDQKVSLYYAEGPNGLSTEPEDSQHAKAFEVAGARNVAQVEIDAAGFGMSSVSLESVIKWNPQVIVAWDEETRGGAAAYIMADPAWAGIQAVQDGRVYEMPNLPFAWCDRPNGVQRWLGIQWLANMLYPDRYDVDMVQRAKEFYSLVYRIELTDEQAREILGSSYPPYKG